MASSQSLNRNVLSILEGRSCDHCEDGELERATYKGNDAVVCAECGMPHVQMWA